MNLHDQLRNKSESRPLQDDDIIHFHYLFMRKFGWIPLEEFKELPIPTFWNLISKIEEEYEQEKQEIEKIKNKKR